MQLKQRGGPSLIEQRAAFLIDLNEKAFCTTCVHELYISVKYCNGFPHIHMCIKASFVIIVLLY